MAKIKVKTKSAAKKRFKVTANGKIKFTSAFRRHQLTCKSRKTKRHLRKSAYVCASDVARVLKMLPYA